ncbi:hypothetical protein, conserved [Babesia bigemina]|uniref:Uncharacterized protein n=1 Tax=Babesia bigemina TaxID=5866 RepID=A0A061D6R2_BABBI|nr:hypothetical protein, conserved [Babesia bigemina]CDR96381.1 hypothetical protein, conserved [Babesia bigemina]|eukprot:XP_012768567.1 hypothetical protein, conserved [Babesia bigemina]
MAEVRVELLDLHSELKCSLFGLVCLITLIAFIYVLCRLAVSPSRMPRSELCVVLLSCSQLVFGIIFYFGDQHPFLHILNKAIKVVQAEIISWSCLDIMLANKKRRRRMAKGLMNFVTCCIALSLLYSYFNVYDHTIYLNAKVGIIMSALWCAMSVAVIYVACKIRRSLDVSKILKIDEEGTEQGQPDSGANLQNFLRDGGDLVESYSDTRYQHLLLLVVVEAIAAMGTLVWDVVLYYSVKQSMNGKGFELDMPVLKEVLYIATNTIVILIPNWTVFYVFYWVQRQNYSNISSTWDVNLNSMKFEVKEPPQTV